MNIWYISKYASPAKYFFGTRHFYISEEWVKTNNRVCVITSNSSHLSENLPKFNSSLFKEDVNGVETIWLNTYKSKSSSGVSRILSWFHFDLKLLFLNKNQTFKPDVIIASSLSLTTVLPAWLLSKKYGCKFVFEVRDIWPLSIQILGGFSKQNLFIKFLSWIERLGYERANLVVGTMPNLREHITDVTDKAVNCICIPQGMSTSFYDNDQIEISPAYLDKWIPKDKFIVCYAGTINVNNPLDNLIAAAKRLRGADNIHFILLGNGNRKDALKSLSDGMNNVSFPPPLPKNQMNSFLKNVHVCYDSFESELAKFGLSRNKWIDYMFAEKPIICSYNGYQSMLNEANCGDFVSFNDLNALEEKIIEYSKMPVADLKTKGTNGKTFLFNNRTFKILADEYLDAIKSC